jgi:hypothetical protein
VTQNIFWIFSKQRSFWKNFGFTNLVTGETGMANDTYPNKPLAPWIPKSQRDSGLNLDEGFPEIESSSANEVMAVDEIFAPLGQKEKS